MPDQPHPIRWTRDTTPADWWRRQLIDSYDRVDALLPPGYEAYARLFHPAAIGSPPEPVSWKFLAQRNRRIVHGLMRFSAISRLPGQPVAGDVVAPSRTLPRPEAQRLVQVLGSDTATPQRCWFCRCADARWLSDRSMTLTLPSGGGAYLLHSGPIAAALEAPPAFDEPDATFLPSRPDLTPDEIEGEYIALRRDLTPVELEAELAAWRAARSARRSPTATDPELMPYRAPIFWWPEDRRWFVATETGLASTFLGGPRALLDRLISDPKLEVLPAALTDSLTDYDDWPNADLDRRAQPVD